MEATTEIDIEQKIIDALVKFYHKGLSDLFDLKLDKEEEGEPKFFGHVTWKTAAQRLGEDLFDQPTKGYFHLSALEWLQASLKEVGELKKIKRRQDYESLKNLKDGCKSENNNVKEECHNDDEPSLQPDGTKFHCLYLHKNHVLFLDWLLNHSRDHTNMLYSLKLAHEIKEATSILCRKIELEEDLERNNGVKKPLFKCSLCGKNCLKIEGGFVQWGCQPAANGYFYN